MAAPVHDSLQTESCWERVDVGPPGSTAQFPEAVRSTIGAATNLRRPMPCRTSTGRCRWRTLGRHLAAESRLPDPHGAVVSLTHHRPSGRRAPRLVQRTGNGGHRARPKELGTGPK
jgi:hypothetical protein